jgi:adenylate cyclase
MSSAPPSDVKFEIGHVLFIDIVGYSKLLITEQRDQLQTLKQIVRATEQFRIAEAEGKLLRLPTGDGGALVFRTNPEAPVLCALEISKQLKEYPELRVRMGVHSGPVNEISDLNEQANIAGAGINIAQRVMNCGDAGHILLSKRVADDLEQYPRWRSLLHDLGECEIKHGLRLHIFNLCDETFGNAALPANVSARRTTSLQYRTQLRARAAIVFVAALLIVAAILIFRSRRIETNVQRTALVVPEQHSIAVLPLVDLSESRNQEYLCDGVSEELLDHLAKVPGLRVAARTSAFSFKGKNVGISEIANQLGVANVIEGSLRRSGNRIRVSAQLINARTGFHLWSDTIERELGDVFAVEDEITQAIVDALKVRLTDGAPVISVKGDAEANDLYLQGLYFSNKSGEEGLRKALSFFQKALDRDPKFSRAWSGIARVWDYLADAYVRPLDAYPTAEAAAERALALDERDPVAHCVLGFSKMVLYWDQEGMFKESKRAVQVDPNSALAHDYFGNTFRGRGDLNRAIEEYRIAAGLDPLSPVVSDKLAEGYLIAGKLNDAIAQGERTLELDPTYAYLDSTLANAYREKGLLDQAITLYQQGEQFTHAPSRGLGITYARAGKRAEAEEVLARFLAQREKKYISAAAIGLIYGALGNKDEAFRWLGRAYNDHDAVLTTIAFYPGSQPLRDDPRFIDLVKRVGLDPTKAIPRQPIMLK